MGPLDAVCSSQKTMDIALNFIEEQHGEHLDDKMAKVTGDDET